MKKIISLSLLAAAALLFGACSTISSRINEKSSVFYSLDPTTRAKIAHGDVDLGFTPDMVYIALGTPDAKRQVTSSSGRTEQWIYRSYYDAYDGTAFVGYHRWYMPYGRSYRVYWEPVYTNVYHEVAQDDIRVTFRDGKVVMIDQART